MEATSLPSRGPSGCVREKGGLHCPASESDKLEWSQYARRRKNCQMLSQADGIPRKVVHQRRLLLQSSSAALFAAVLQTQGHGQGCESAPGVLPVGQRL